MLCWVGVMLTRCYGILEGMEGDVKTKINFYLIAIIKNVASQKKWLATISYV